MSRDIFAVLLAIYACLGWGMIAPMAVRLSQHLGPDKFHPALPFLWNALGAVFFSCLLLFFTDFAPLLKVWSWHWSGWVIFLTWPSASLALVYGYSYAPARVSVINAIAATYPATVSALVLWYYLGETMSLQKILGLILVVVGIIITVLA